MYYKVIVVHFYVQFRHTYGIPRPNNNLLVVCREIRVLFRVIHSRRPAPLFFSLRCYLSLLHTLKWLHINKMLAKFSSNLHLFVCILYFIRFVFMMLLCLLPSKYASVCCIRLIFMLFTMNYGCMYSHIISSFFFFLGSVRPVAVVGVSVFLFVDI